MQCIRRWGLGDDPGAWHSRRIEARLNLAGWPPLIVPVLVPRPRAGWKRPGPWTRWIVLTLGMGVFFLPMAAPPRLKPVHRAVAGRDDAGKDFDLPQPRAKTGLNAVGTRALAVPMIRS